MEGGEGESGPTGNHPDQLQVSSLIAFINFFDHFRNIVALNCYGIK